MTKKKSAPPSAAVLKLAREKVGTYLRDIRTHRELSQRDLAERAAVTQGQVSAVELGSTAYTIDTFLAITSALDCYFYLADRGGKERDAKHLIEKMRDPI